MNIIESVGKYEIWLREQLNGDVFEDDIGDKHEKMADGAFQFLRATSWRDEEGRLVWGVNDFDEAAYMPYAIDLARLATSAMLATEMGLSITAREICDSILEGYTGGIESDAPKPFVLDREHDDMRKVFVVNDRERAKFWKKFDSANIAETFESAGAETERPKIRPVAEPPKQYEKVLRRARPDPTVELNYFERTAGTGSLGRPRYVGIGEWRGDLIVRETKAMVPSGWVLAHGGSHRLLCEEIAWCRNRAPDPSYRLRGRVLVRRLSPNDFKIEVKEAKKKDGKKKGKKKAAGAPDEQDNHKAVDPNTLVNAERLRDMGSDLASIHRGTRGRRKEIAADLKRRGAKWLLAAATAAQEQIEKDWGDWCKAYGKSASAGSKKEKKTKKKSKKGKKKKPKTAKKGK